MRLRFAVIGSRWCRESHDYFLEVNMNNNINNDNNNETNNNSIQTNNINSRRSLSLYSLYCLSRDPLNERLGQTIDDPIHYREDLEWNMYLSCVANRTADSPPIFIHFVTFYHYCVVINSLRITFPGLNWGTKYVGLDMKSWIWEPLQTVN